LLKLNELAIKD